MSVDNTCVWCGHDGTLGRHGVDVGHPFIACFDANGEQLERRISFLAYERQLEADARTSQEIQDMLNDALKKKDNA